MNRFKLLYMEKHNEISCAIFVSLKFSLLPEDVSLEFILHIVNKKYNFVFCPICMSVYLYGFEIHECIS